MLDLVALRGLPSAHFDKQLQRAELLGKFDLARLRQAVIGGYLSDGRFVAGRSHKRD